MTVNSAQQYHTNQVHYLVADIDFSDTTVSLGWIPAGAVVIECGVNVVTAFNAATNDLLDIGYRNAGDGTADDTDEFATAVDISAVGRKAVDSAINTAAETYFPEGAEIVAVYTQSGTAADAGAGKVWITYLVEGM